MKGDRDISDKRQLFGDPDFKNGFYVIGQRDHANGGTVKRLGSFTRGGDVGIAPSWGLCQWDSGPCLWADRVPSPANVLTDGATKTVSLDRTSGALTLALNSKKYYNGRGAVRGDCWPHLLIEQAAEWPYGAADSDEKLRYRLLPGNRLTVSFDVRLASYSLDEVENDWVRAGQLLMFFYMRSVETNDFIWLGLPLFDNRDPDVSRYAALDGGKPDASHALIFSLSHAEVYGTAQRRPAPEYDGFAHVKVELNDYMREAFEHGRKLGCVKSGSLSSFYIGGFNYGWELIGSFDVAAELKNLSLTSETA